MPFYVIKKDGEARFGGSFPNEIEAVDAYRKVLIARRVPLELITHIEVEEYVDAVPPDQQ
jgi:hypothetical protein